MLVELWCDCRALFCLTFVFDGCAADFGAALVLQLQSPRGVLLHGPSGCGKSSIATAVARVCQVPLLVVKVMTSGTHRLDAKLLARTCLQWVVVRSAVPSLCRYVGVRMCLSLSVFV